MSTKPSYFKIGLFVVISVTLMVIATIIWGAGLFRKDKIFYETYFDSPVVGLTPGSSVLLMGVKIGQVESVEFASDVYDVMTDPEKVSEYEHYVRVICSVERKEDEKRVNSITEQQREVRIKEMIRKGLRLRLASNILTGQAYLEGVYLESKRFPILEISWEPKYLYVPSVPGTFSTMRDSVDKILEKLEEVDVKNMTEEIQGLFAELRQTNQHIQGLLASPDPNAESTNLAEILVKFDNTLDELNSKIKTEGPEVGKILRNVKVISDDIKELTTTLKKHPSEILFSQPPAKSEIVK